MSQKSGLADSPFFTPPPNKQATQAPVKARVTPIRDEQEPTTPPPISEQEPIYKSVETNRRNLDNTNSTDRLSSSENHDAMEATMQPRINARKHASLHASNNASLQSLMHENIIEVIRKAVKDVGKDSATFRFTSEEKKALLELSFSYKMQGYKTSENELIRIAINFLLEDQKENGRNSVLQRVLDALNK